MYHANLPTCQPANLLSVRDSNSQAFLNDLDARLWKSADRLRQQLDAANYKHIVLGFIFLKYISDTFSAHQEKLLADFANPEHEFHYPQDDLSDADYQAVLAQE